MIRWYVSIFEDFVRFSNSFGFLFLFFFKEFNWKLNNSNEFIFWSLSAPAKRPKQVNYCYEIRWSKCKYWVWVTLICQCNPSVKLYWTMSVNVKFYMIASLKTTQSKKLIQRKQVQSTMLWICSIWFLWD